MDTDGQMDTALSSVGLLFVKGRYQVTNFYVYVDAIYDYGAFYSQPFRTLRRGFNLFIDCTMPIAYITAIVTDKLGNFKTILLRISLVIYLSHLTNCQIQRITVRPETVNVTQGTDLTLPCKVENRAGRVQWVKSGVTLGYDREVAGYSRYSVIGAEGEGEFNFHIANVR